MAHRRADKAKEFCMSWDSAFHGSIPPGYIICFYFLWFYYFSSTSGQLLDGLSSRRFDLIFASQPPADLGLTSISVSRQDLVLITPRKHPLAQFHTINLAQTIPYPQVYFAKGSGLRYVIDGLYRQIGQEPQIAYETEEDSVIAGLVAHGFGIAVVPYMEILHRLDVKIMQISNPAWERNFYLVSNDRSYLTPAAREFRQFIISGVTL